MTQRSLKHFEKNVYRKLRGYVAKTDSDLFLKQAQAFEKGKFVVQLFYVSLFFFAANTFLFTWDDWVQLPQLPQPIWALKWTIWFSWATVFNILGIGVIFATGSAAIWPNNRFLRILSFVTFFLLIGITNSFGKINHSFHVWVLGGLFLIFLPKLPAKSVTSRQTYLTAIWGTQLLTLVFYTSSGMWKLIGITEQLFRGEIHSLHPLALSQQVAHRLVQTNSDSLLGPFFIENTLIGWPLYSGSVLLELFSVVVAFRPKLHRFWGICLIIFHFAIWLTMNIEFHTNMLFLMIFFVLSPFHPKALSFSDIFTSLPIINLVRQVNSKPNS